MSRTEHRAQRPSVTTGLFAALRAFLHLPGSSAPSSTPAASRLGAPRTLLVPLFAVAGLLLAGPATASAAFTHFLQPAASFPFEGIKGPEGLAVDQAGHVVYVATQDHSVLKFDTSGQPQEFSALASNKLPTRAPTRLAVDSSGDLYVLHFAGNEVQTVTIGGAPTGGTFTLTFEGQTTEPIHFNAGPETVQADLTALSSIHRTSGGGGYNVAVRGNPGGPYTIEFIYEKGGSNQPQLTCDASGLTPSGTCAVATEADGFPAAIAKYLPSGEPDPTTPEIGFGAPSNPRGVAVNSSGDVYVATGVFKSGTGAIEKEIVDEFSPTGELVNTFGASVFTGELSDLAIDSAGNVYVATQSGVIAFEAGGACIDSCNPIDSGEARAVGVEPGTDRLYVADAEPTAKRVTVNEYDSAAHGYAPFGSFGSEDFSGCVQCVRSLAIDGSSGDVYVGDLSPGPNGHVYVFGPGVIIPTLHAAPPTNLQPTSATLGGTVNTAGTEAADALTECRFAYVTEEAFAKTGFQDLSSGGEAPCEPPPAGVPNDGADHPVTAPISGLTPTTAYRFRLYAANHNDEGKPNHADGEFTTAGPPRIDATSADHLISIAATLHAQVNPFELDTEARFQYISEADFKANGDSFTGPHPATSTALKDLGSGLGDAPLDQVVSGLAPETAYRFRALATNSAAPAGVEGPERTFMTLPPALLDAQPPTALTTTSATLRAFLDPLGLHTTYRFQYVDSESFQHEGGFASPHTRETSVADGGAGAAFLSESEPIEGLQPNTEYRFRALATNSAGTHPGPDFAFTTSPSSCPNEELRKENDSTALPQCRAYEQVSPIDKGGYEAKGATVAPDGERAVFSSGGVFAGDPTTGHVYLAHRTAAGWSTEGVDPPWSLGTLMDAAAQRASADLSQFIAGPVALGASGPTLDPSSYSTFAFFLRAPDGSWTQASPPLQRTHPKEELSDLSVEGTSADLSHFLIQSTASLLPSDKIPASPFNLRYYEVVGAGTPSPVLRLVGVENGESGAELPLCRPEAMRVGLMIAEPHISPDGSTIFFDTWSSKLPGGCAEPGGERPYQLLARVGGQATVDLSEPTPSECGVGPAPPEVSCRNAPLTAAAFATSAADGSRAFFLSTQQLTDDASEDPNSSSDGPSGTLGANNCANSSEGRSGCNLYMYDFKAPAGHHLTALSAGDTSGSGPQAHAVLGVAADGRRVYFEAGGILTNQANVLGQLPQPGGHNLYVFDTETGHVAFIATSTPGGDDVTPDGRYLLFTSDAQLTPDDTNLAVDVYEYDAQTGAIVRVSTGHEGEDQNGNGGGQDATATATIQRPGDATVGHAISDDGQTVVFRTARPLQGSAENGLVNAYEWRQGQVDLISGGRSPNPVNAVNVSASGRDLVFETAQGLIPTDTDGLPDVYDARLGGGFPLPQPPPAPCEGAETCHAEGSHPEPPPTIGTGEFRHGPEPVEERCKKGFVRKHGHCVKVRKHHHKRRHHKRAANTNRRAGR